MKDFFMTANEQNKTKKQKKNALLMARLMLVQIWIIIFYFPSLFFPFRWITWLYPLAINFYIWANRVRMHDLTSVDCKKSQGMIYASNHKCFSDPVFISKFIPRPFAYTMDQHVADIIPPFKIIIAKMRFVPIDHRSVSGLLRSYNTIRKRLKDKISLIFFPEGKYVIGEPVGQLRGGIAKIAKNTGAKVVPVALYGIDQNFLYEKKLIWRDVYVKMGEPLDFEDFNGDERLFVSTLRSKIAQLYAEIEAEVNQK